MAKLESKHRLDRAMEWLEEEPAELASTAAKMFNVNASSIQMRQLRQRNQERNSRGTYNQHGGNNIILTEAQEQAVFRFCHDQVEMGLGATPSIIYAAICYLRQQEQRNPPSLSWFRQWLKKNPSLHTIKAKPIARVRITSHTETDLKNFFLDYQNTLSKYGIKRAKYIFNMDESGVRIGCPTGEIVVVPMEIKELYTASPENRKSITIIETICANGSKPLPPVVICPGEKIMENWIQDNLTGAEVIAVSQTGYTNENIALSWLNHFIKHSGAGPDKHWRILLLDGHITHCKEDFVIHCHENHIVPFQFPSHLTHVLQPLDVGVFRPWKHYHNKAIHRALHSLDTEYTLSSFFRDLSSIREETFQPYTIKNAFLQSGMFPVSCKMALKKMRHYTNRTSNRKQLSVGISTSNSVEGSEQISEAESDDLELPTLPSTYFECQQGMGEWIERAETFSPTSKTRFQQWAKGTQISLAQAELQQQTYHNVQSRIQEAAKHKSNSRRVIQTGGEISVQSARLKKKQKSDKEKAAAIKKAQRSIQTAVNKAKASLHRRGVDARKAEKERKNQVRLILAAGGIVPAELLIAIPDPEKSPSAEDLESLQAPPDLLQALLMLEPAATSTTSVIDPQLLGLGGETGDWEIYTTRQQVDQAGIANTYTGNLNNCEDSGGESDSDSSCISTDSITRNANFVALN